MSQDITCPSCGAKITPPAPEMPAGVRRRLRNMAQAMKMWHITDAELLDDILPNSSLDGWKYALTNGSITPADLEFAADRIIRAEGVR